MAILAENLEQGKSGQVTELFPYRMPFAVAGGIASFLIVFCTTAFIASLIVKIPETVQAPFVLTPAGGADPVQSPFDGVIEAVHAVAPHEVVAGDLLFTIRAPQVQALAAERRTLEKDLAGVAQRREAIEEDYAVARRLQDAEIAQRKEEVEYRTKYFEVYQEVRGRIQALAKAGLAPTIELLNQQLGQAEAERDLALANEQRKSAQLALDRIEADHTHELEKLEQEEARLRIQIEGFSERLRDTASDLVEVRAPSTGMLLSVARRRPGDVVAVGQELCQLAPHGVPLIAKVQLPERFMARLREKQTTRLLFEAFPYQRYGVVEGRVIWISPAPLNADQGNEDAGGFVAHVTIDTQNIGQGDAARPLRAGMGGEARIHTGRRTLIEYAFEPLRSLRENLRGDGVSAQARSPQTE